MQPPDAKQRLRRVGVIPARYGSTRFPGKALADIRGKPMIARVYERATMAGLDDLRVATDDERIRDACEQAGIPVVMTRSDHLSGTDRVAEVVRRIGGDIIINIQGDEPLIDPGLIRRLADALQADADADMASACRPIVDPADVLSPNVVKVVFAVDGRALYFSRCPIPWDKHRDFRHYRHIGIYGYRAESLLRLVELPPSRLERAESLEQLRALENGLVIKMMETETDALGIDTPEDLERLLAMWKE